MVQRLSRHLVFALLCASSALSVAAACTPREEAAAIAAVPALVDGACVLIHALASGDQAAQSVCATAEDLAPIVRVLFASRQGDASDASSRNSAHSPVRLVQVAELPVPKGPPAIRCVAWETVAGSGASDAGNSR